MNDIPMEGKKESETAGRRVSKRFQSAVQPSAVGESDIGPANFVYAEMRQQILAVRAAGRELRVWNTLSCAQRRKYHASRRTSCPCHGH